MVIKPKLRISVTTLRNSNNEMHLFGKTRWKKKNAKLGSQQHLWQESKACTIAKISEDKANSQTVNQAWVDQIWLSIDASCL